MLLPLSVYLSVCFSPIQECSKRFFIYFCDFSRQLRIKHETPIWRFGLSECFLVLFIPSPPQAEVLCRSASVCVCVCVRWATTACHISLGGEGNALYLLLSSFVIVILFETVCIFVMFVGWCTEACCWFTQLVGSESMMSRRWCKL